MGGYLKEKYYIKRLKNVVNTKLSEGFTIDIEGNSVC